MECKFYFKTLNDIGDETADIVPVSDDDEDVILDEDDHVKSKFSLEAQRGVTGVLNSHPESRDLHVTQVNNNNNNNTYYIH